MRWLALVAVLSAAACYRPALEEACLLSCADSTDCPAHLTCATGTCVDPATGIGGCAPTDGSPADVPVDGRICVGSDAPPYMEVCALPADDKTYPDGTLLDTDSNTNCDFTVTKPATGDRPACVVYANNLTLEGAFGAHGSRLLVLLALDKLTISGRLDVAGHLMTPNEQPAGSPSPACGPTGMPGDNAIGAGGGAGGGFATVGGNGGTAVSGATAGAAAPFTDTSTLFRAGCDGDEGGAGNGNMTTGAPGRGGGGVYLLAMNAIEFGISGEINASGAGAAPPTKNAGGSGGGSGGMIVLDAPTLVGLDNAVVFALGGGASSGASSSDPGNAGGDPTSFNAVGRGGTNNLVAGNGGDGSDVAAGSPGKNGQAGGSMNTGGGGGGGGQGSIRVRTGTDLGAAMKFAPPPQL